MNNTKQLRVLQYIINNTEWLDKINDELFQREYRKILGITKFIDKKGLTPSFQSIRHLLEEQDLLSEQTVLNEISKATPLDLPTFKLHLEEVRIEAEQRIVIESGNVDPTDPKQREAVVKRLISIQSIETPELGYELSDFFDFNDYIRDTGEVMSTFPFLDGTGAELCLGNLLTLVAITGHGKSLIKAYLTRRLITRGKNVLYVGFEETKQEFNARVSRGFLNLTEHQLAELKPEEYRTGLRTLFDKSNIKRGQLDFVQVSGMNVEDLTEFTRELEAEKGYKYDAVMIDYSRYLTQKKKTKDTKDYAEQEYVFKKLKEFAMTPNDRRLVVTSVQANRAAYQKNSSPKLENLAGSMGPAHNSDLVLGIFRKGISSQSNKQAHELKPSDILSNVQISIRKKRHGSIQEDDVFYYNMLANNNLNAIAEADFESLHREFEIPVV